MIILGFDTETSDMPIWGMPSEDPDQPHIVQLAAVLADSSTREVIEKMDVIVRPDGWDIKQETIDKHGITMERAMAEGIPEAQALDAFNQMWLKCQLRTAFNTTFDNRIIRIAQMRYFNTEHAHHAEWIRSWHEDKELYYCAMYGAKKAMGVKKLPTLGEAYQHFTGKPLENAHQAMADTMACMEIYFAINGKPLPAEPVPTPMPAATNDLIAELDDSTGLPEKPDDEVAFL